MRHACSEEYMQFVFTILFSIIHPVYIHDAKSSRSLRLRIRGGFFNRSNWNFSETLTLTLLTFTPAPSRVPPLLNFKRNDRQIQIYAFTYKILYYFRPDIAALRTAAAVVPRPTATPALEDLEPAPRRQASVDAEAIRIVIHDVDSAPAASAQRRIILRRDPTDKAHRSKLNTTR